MTLLIDSHVIAWMTIDSRHISPAVAVALRESGRAGEGIAIASSSLWEIAMMASRGEMRTPGTLESFLRGLESVFVVLPITGSIAARSVQFRAVFRKTQRVASLRPQRSCMACDWSRMTRESAVQVKWTVFGSGMTS